MTFEDAVLNKYYQQFISEAEGLPQGETEYTPITTENRTTDEIRSQVAAAIRPTVDQSINTLKSNVTSQRASVDADAASRGMGRSTFVTDIKARLSRAEQENVANIESNYGATLAQRVSEAWENQRNRNTTIDAQNVSNRMNVSQFNTQRKVMREREAYERAQYFKAVEDALKSSGGYRPPNDDRIMLDDGKIDSGMTVRSLTDSLRQSMEKRSTDPATKNPFLFRIP